MSVMLRMIESEHKSQRIEDEERILMLDRVAAGTVTALMAAARTGLVRHSAVAETVTGLDLPLQYIRFQSMYFYFTSARIRLYDYLSCRQRT